MREAVMHGAKTWQEVEAVLKNATKLTASAATNDLLTNRVEVLQGQGSVTGERSMTVTPLEADGEVKELNFDALVIATGSKSNRFPPVKFDLPGVYDSDTIANIKRVPKTMVIQGAGIIGLEYGQIFAGLGTKVTIIEMFDQMVPMLDVSLQDACRRPASKSSSKRNSKKYEKGRVAQKRSLLLRLSWQMAVSLSVTASFLRAAVVAIRRA